MEQDQINAKNLKKKYFLKKLWKQTQKKLEKQEKEKLLLLIPENIGDRVFNVCKTKIPTEYRGKCIRGFKN